MTRKIRGIIVLPSKATGISHAGTSTNSADVDATASSTVQPAPLIASSASATDLELERFPENRTTAPIRPTGSQQGPTGAQPAGGTLTGTRHPKPGQSGGASFLPASHPQELLASKTPPLRYNGLDEAREENVGKGIPDRSAGGGREPQLVRHRRMERQHRADRRFAARARRAAPCRLVPAVRHRRHARRHTRTGGRSLRHRRKRALPHANNAPGRPARNGIALQRPVDKRLASALRDCVLRGMVVRVPAHVLDGAHFLNAGESAIRAAVRAAVFRARQRLVRERPPRKPP